MPQRKYEVSDPTGSEFHQVTDVTDRTGPFEVEDPETRQKVKRYGGTTAAAAIFTAYLTKASNGRLNPQVEANALCQRLNGTNTPPPPSTRFVMEPGDFTVKDTIAEKAIAIFRSTWCPNAQQECAALVARLNGQG